MNFKISPSDLSFSFEGCKRCFYLKTHHNIYQPSIPMAPIFKKIDSLLTSNFSGKRTEELHKEIPPGTIIYGERKVESQNIRFTGHQNTCFIRGRFDTVIKFDDGTYGVFDYKTAEPGNHSHLYGRQLHSYAYALENPAVGELHLSPISMLGLIYTPPSKISRKNIDWVSFDAEVYLVKIEKDMNGFLDFLEGVLSLMESPDIPDSDSQCLWCNYIGKINKL